MQPEYQYNDSYSRYAYKSHCWQHILKHYKVNIVVVCLDGLALH